MRVTNNISVHYVLDYFEEKNKDMVAFTIFHWPWWRHQMDTFSELLAICAGNSPVIGEFPTQRPMAWNFDIFFDLRPDKRLSKQS